MSHLLRGCHGRVRRSRHPRTGGELGVVGPEDGAAMVDAAVMAQIITDRVQLFPSAHAQSTENGDSDRSL